MNKKGTKKTLKAAQDGNTNAEKSGSHSPRRQAQETAKLEQAYGENPELFLQQDRVRLYLVARGKLELFDRDIDENGVSDRDGNQRRVVGTHRRYFELCEKLNAELQASEAADYDDTEPFSEAEGMGTLRMMIHDDRVAGSARFAIIQFLLQRLAEAKPDSYDEEFFRQLVEMTPEELDRELQCMMIPVRSGRWNRPGHGTTVEHPRTMILRLGAQDTISDHDLADLKDSMDALFNPPSLWPRSEDEC